MGKKEIVYKDTGELRADQVQSLVEKVAPRYFKGDEHQREIEAGRIVFSFLQENGPFEAIEDAYARLVAGWGSGKSHASAVADSGEAIPYYGYHTRSKYRNVRVK